MIFREDLLGNVWQFVAFDRSRRARYEVAVLELLVCVPSYFPARLNLN